MPPAFPVRTTEPPRHGRLVRISALTAALALGARFAPGQATVIHAHRSWWPSSSSRALHPGDGGPPRMRM